MSLNLKDGILKAVKEAKAFDDAVTESKTPRFRKPTAPPRPNAPTVPLTTNQPNVGSSVQPPKKSCDYETPCGWCSKRDKKCDKKIGGGNDTAPRKSKDATLEWIKSGKGLPPI